jgi:hypothetical protein
MTLLSFWGVYRKKDRPYNPVIASGRGAKRRRAPKQATEITKKLAISVEGSRQLKPSGFRNSVRNENRK